MNTSSLSLLRFIAAIIVVLFHQTSTSTFLQAAPKILTAGPQVVSFFFVLSGFTLALAYYNKEKFSLREYYAKRIARIIPVYLIALSLSVGLDIAQGQLEPVALVLNIFLMQSWFPTYPLSINTPAWFLSDLMFFYISFPFILALLKKYFRDPKRVLLSGIVFWLITQTVLALLLNTSFYKGYPSPSHDFIFYFPPSHLCSFILGMCVGYFLVNKKDPFPMTYAKSVYFILLIIAALVIAMEYQSEYDEVMMLKLPFDASFYAPLFLLLIVAFCMSNNRITALLSLKPFIYLGKISFSVYIMQSPVSRILSLYVRRHTYYLSDDAFILIYIFVLIVVGMILLHTIEHPIREYMKRRSLNLKECPIRQ